MATIKNNSLAEVEEYPYALQKKINSIVEYVFIKMFVLAHQNKLQIRGSKIGDFLRDKLLNYAGTHYGIGFMHCKHA